MTYPDPTAGPNYSPPTYDPPPFQPPAFDPPAYQPPTHQTPPQPRQPTPPQTAAPQTAASQTDSPPTGSPQTAPLRSFPPQGPPTAYGRPPTAPPAMPYQVWTGDDPAQRQINLAEDAARGRRDITVGAIWFAVGGFITLATMASDASVYVVAWGPMLYGAYRVIKGVIAVRRVG